MSTSTLTQEPLRVEREQQRRSNIVAPTPFFAALPKPLGLLRVLVVGPELLASALCALLSTIDDLQVLSPLSDPDQVAPFVRRVASTERPVDVVVIHWSGNRESDHHLLETLAALGVRCLVVTSLIYPNELEYIKGAGARGFFFTAGALRQLTTALRTIARGQKYFPALESSPAPPPDSTEMTLAYLRIQRTLVFHRERLEALAREIMWELTENEIKLFYYIADTRVEEIADKITLRPTTVRRALSERIYEFLRLISGKPVPNRFVAFQVLQEYGILEYVIVPPR